MIKDRLTQVLEYKRIPKELFYEKIGQKSANFRGENRKKALNSDVIENILTEIPDLNPIWFLTGKGEMLLEIDDKDLLKDKETPVQRIGRIAKREGVAITKLEHRIGMSRGALSRAIRVGSDINVNWISALAEVYPKYDMHWLITGLGTMILRRAEPKPVNFDEIQNRLLELLSQKDKEINELKKEFESQDNYIHIVAESQKKLKRK